MTARDGTAARRPDGPDHDTEPRRTGLEVLAAILRQVREGPYQPDALPAQIIAPRAGRLRRLVDADAAADLESRGRDR